MKTTPDVTLLRVVIIRDWLEGRTLPKSPVPKTINGTEEARIEITRFRFAAMTISS
jgi:hypothetical protein